MAIPRIYRVLQSKMIHDREGCIPWTTLCCPLLTLHHQASWEFEKEFAMKIEIKTKNKDKTKIEIKNKTKIENETNTKAKTPIKWP